MSRRSQGESRRFASSNSYSSFNPLTLPNCVLWLRSDLGITTVTGNVSQWNDQSTAGNNATQATGANRPSYNTGGVNGRPYLSGNGGTTAFMSGSSISSITQATVVAVSSYTSNGTAAPCPFATLVANGVNSGISLLYVPATPAFIGRIEPSGGPGVVDASFSGTLDTSLHQHIVTASGTGATVTSTYYQDGVQKATNNGPSTSGGLNTGLQYSVGAINQSATDVWGGNYYEFLVYSRVLSTAEIASLHKYAQALYSIA